MVRTWQMPAKRKGLTPQQRTRVFTKDDGRCQGEGCGIKIDAARGDPFFCAHLHEDGKALWQGNDGRFDVNDYRTLCEGCWKGDTAEEAGDRADERKARTKHVTGRSKAPKGRPMPGTKESGIQIKMNGDVIDRETGEIVR